MTGNREIAEDRARAILGNAGEITAAQERSACLVLAGLALNAADGDWETARTLLRVPLEAVGAIGGGDHPRYPDGRLKKSGGAL